MRFNLASVGLKGQLAKDAQEDFLSVIRRDASVQSHIVSASLLTGMRGRHLHGHEGHHLVLFAGRGPQAALQAGLRVVSADHEVVQLFALVVTLDLTTESGSCIMWHTLNTHGVAAVHFGLQRSTSGRARELPIPEAMKRAGVPEPLPVRSAEHALGIPGLAELHWKK